MNYVFGYIVVYDVSVWDWQFEFGRNGGQWLIGKVMDGFCFLGFVIVMKEDINGIILNFFVGCFVGVLLFFLWMGRGLEFNFFFIFLF